jgi:hypothetical protein
MKEVMMTSEELDKIFSQVARELAQLLFDRAGWQVNERQLCKILRQVMIFVSADQVVGLRAQGVPVSEGDVHALARILAEIILFLQDCPGGGEALVDHPFRGMVERLPSSDL